MHSDDDKSPQADIEFIPPTDMVSRCCYAVPGVTLDPATDFPFERDRRKIRCESVIWRKYAPRIEDVATRGLKVLHEMNIRRASKNPPETLKEYVGARTGIVGDIRSIQSQRGFCIAVEHLPDNGDLAHAHMTINKIDPAGRNLEPTDKTELVDALLDVMPLE